MFSEKKSLLNGMALSQQYFTQCGQPMIMDKFHDHQNEIAVGLVGEGSECYGYDDDVSRDHDWGPSFCLWINKDAYKRFGKQLEIEYSRLPKEYMGHKIFHQNEFTEGRRGVFEIGAFYKKYTGLSEPPVSNKQWRLIPEMALSTVTNGQVFVDHPGVFSDFRNRLLAFYPEDIRRKKMAARCAIMAQAGQYNYNRCIQRGEHVAANHALSQFIETGISMIYLLNKSYKPYYKWMHKGLRELPICGRQGYEAFEQLVSKGPGSVEAESSRKSQLIEAISAMVIEALRAQALSDHTSDFLMDHAHVIQASIGDQEIRAYHVMAE